MDIDFGKTSSDYAKHRLGFPEEFFVALRDREHPAQGARVLDIGCGTGTLALRFAADGAIVTALDPSQRQLEIVRRSASRRAVSLELVHNTFEDNSLPNNAFDFISAGQCWHWLDARSATEQISRLLAPGGHVLLCSYDWLPGPNDVVSATEALILEHNPDWKFGGMNGRHPEWQRNLEAGGFEIVETHYARHDAIYSHENWRGRIRASAPISASLPKNAVPAFDRQLAELLRIAFPEDPLRIPHMYGFCLARRKP